MALETLKDVKAMSDIKCCGSDCIFQGDIGEIDEYRCENCGTLIQVVGDECRVT